MESGACVSNTRACTVTGGTGTQTWNGTSYAACVATACTTGYSLVSGACTRAGNVLVERMGKTLATRGVAELGSALLGLGGAGRTLADMGGQLLTLRFSRDDESEADALGLVLASRAGYRPGAGVSLWRKMMAASKGAPPQWLSTHPSGDTRIRDMEARMARVEPFFDQAAKPDRRFAPPKA